LLCLPIFLWALFEQDSRLAAALILGALGATDWIDGYVARRFNQVSPLGAILDPTVDRLLFIVGLVALGIDGAVPWVIAGLILFSGGGNRSFNGCCHCLWNGALLRDLPRQVGNFHLDVCRASPHACS
jgi:hypothetical protein